MITGIKRRPSIPDLNKLQALLKLIKITRVSTGSEPPLFMDPAYTNGCIDKYCEWWQRISLVRNAVL